VANSQNGWTEDQEIARLSQFTPPNYSGVDGTNTTSGGYLPSSTLEPGEIPLQGRALSLFEDAMLAYDEKRYGNAEALLNDAFRLAPFHTKLCFYLGICMLAEGNAHDAIPLLKLATSIKDSRGRRVPTSYAPAAHFCLAKAYLQMRDLYSAEEQLKDAPEIPEAQALLTQVQQLLAQRSK
jgi:tetratricopeptide (TPR) repeat protein